MGEHNDRRKLVVGFVRKRIVQLQKGYLSTAGKSWASAQLACLRRAASSVPGADSDVWAIEFEGIPEELLGVTEEPSAGEWAVHLGLTLYAVHQQSKRTEMYRPNDPKAGQYYGLGNAVKRLSLSDGSTVQELGEMPRRFAALVTAQSMEEVAHYTRQLIQQLRDRDLQLDHALLAGQLYDYCNPYRRDGVRLMWAREFARPLARDNEREETSHGSNAD